MSGLLDSMASLSEVATPLRFVWLNTQLQQLSDVVGFPTDQLRCLFCLFAAYPLASVLTHLPGTSAKHWMNIIVGISMAQLIYSAGWLHSFVSATITYLLLKLAPTVYAPYIVFVFNMAFVATLHIHRMYVDYMGWSMDSTASQMILLIKLTSFAYNYYDGVVGNSEPISNRTQETRRRLAITKLPSLLEYFGYVYNFTTFIAGPAFEFREYMNAIEGAQFVFKGQRRTASPLGAAAMKLALSLIFMVMLVAFGPYTDLMGVLRMQESIAVKWGHILVALFLTRVKYYVAWKLAEGATILSGAGFEGFDEQGNVKGWNGVSNVDILGFEFGESIRDLSRSWNKGTQQWLERYVYSRTGNSLVATYMCSAIWHGFYPGYYLFFLTVPLATAVNRLARRHLRVHFVSADGTALPSKRLYDLAGMLCTSLIVNYLAVSFVVLSWERALFGFQSMYFAGHIGLVVVYLLLSVLPSKKKTKTV